MKAGLRTPVSDYLVDMLDKYYKEHPDLSVGQTLEALEIIRHSITEAWLAFRTGSVPKW